MNSHLTIDLLKKYIHKLEIEQQLSKNTIDSYQLDIKEFIIWWQNSEIEVLNPKSIQYFIASLSRKKQKPTSISRKLSSLRQFFDYLTKIGIILENPAKSINPPRKVKSLAKTLSADNLNQMLDNKESDFDLTNPINIRDFAIIELFYSSGMRLSELATLNVSALDFDNNQTLILGKGGKERYVLIGEKAKLAINSWIKLRKEFTNTKKNIEENKSQTDALFLNKRGGRLGVRSIQLRVKARAKKLNVNIDLHPHMLRHSFASHILQSSGDLRAVQELLGHDSIASTQIYTDLDFTQLSKVYDKFHPRAKKD